jgi:hypothetical protein
MDARRKQLALAALGMAALALVALAMGVGSLSLAPGRPVAFGVPAARSAGEAPPVGLDPRLFLVAVIWICLLVTLVSVVLSRSLRRYLLHMLPLYIVYGLLMYLLFSGLYSMTRQEQLAPVQPPPLAAGEPPPLPEQATPVAPPEFVARPPQWLVLAVSLAVGLIAAGAAWLVVQRGRWPASAPGHPLAEIAREAQSALTEIAGGGGLRNAVLRCYAEMSRALTERSGVRQDQTMTPREFEQRLAATGIRDEHVRRLTRLFEAVRYGPHEPGEREEAEATECLRAIVAAYGQPRGGSS